jgi:hypothetical protein
MFTNKLSSVVWACALLGLALPSASAQSAIFQEDFEASFSQWIVQGQWHSSTMDLDCGVLPAPPSGSLAARFGNPGKCLFGKVKGFLTTGAPVALPSAAQAARLRFHSMEFTECVAFQGCACNCGWDHRSVYVSPDGATWTLVWEGGAEGVWIEKSVDLSTWLGQEVWIRFEFDPIDEIWNEFPGWLVDDVQVEIDEVGGPTIYCQPKVNSLGCGPLMSYSGDPSLSGPDDLVLSTSNLRNNVYGSFAWSTGINNTPFQGGTLCVQIPARRTTTVSTGGSAAPKLDCSGSYTWLFSHDYLVVNGIEPGETVHCQYFGRDVDTGAPMTLSDAVRVTILP